MLNLFGFAALAGQHPFADMAEWTLKRVQGDDVSE
jgi:hypothetical protein